MSAKEFIKRVLRATMPEALLLLLARLGRWYVRTAPWQFGKISIITGRFFLLRLCDVCRLRTFAETEFGTRHQIQFPDAIQRSIFYFGVWEPAVTAFVKGSLSAGDTFIDVGANIGYYACLASKLVGPSGQVHAIEASPIIWRQLNENLNLNEASNVRSYNVAVLDHKSTVSVYHPPGWERNTGVTSVLKTSGGMHTEAQVEALPLPEIIEASELFGARLVKIDVEGAEWFVVNGIKDLLHRFSPKTEWLIEITPTDVAKSGGSVTELTRMFTGAGYELYQIENYYDEQWYLQRRREILAQSPDELPKPVSENIRDQIDVLFTRQRYH